MTNSDDGLDVEVVIGYTTTPTDDAALLSLAGVDRASLTRFLDANGLNKDTITNLCKFLAKVNDQHDLECAIQETIDNFNAS